MLLTISLPVLVSMCNDGLFSDNSSKDQYFPQKYMVNPFIEEIPVSTIISPTIDNWLISTKGQDKNQLIYKLLTIGEPYLVLILPTPGIGWKRSVNTSKGKA